MRRTTGTLSDLTTALNEAITELAAPGGQATGTLASATARLNALLMFESSELSQADGTLVSAVRIYNAFTLRTIGIRNVEGVFFSNYQVLGTTTTINNRTMDVTATIVQNNGNRVTLTEAVAFPGILADIPANKRDPLLRQLILDVLRIKHGVDA